MRTPRYIFAGEFQQFYDYFLAQPHTPRHFHAGETIWQPGTPHAEIHYIVRGSEMHYALHENGHRKIVSFHGGGTIFPGYHQLNFKIERALVTEALSEMDVLAFSKTQFQRMFETNTALAEAVVNWYATYVNRFLFETVHQDYNSSTLQLANLLYLLVMDQPESDGHLRITQENLAELLGLSRVQITRALGALRTENLVATSRGEIIVRDLTAMAARCSSETLND